MKAHAKATSELPADFAEEVANEILRLRHTPAFNRAHEIRVVDAGRPGGRGARAKRLEFSAYDAAKKTLGPWTPISVAESRRRWTGDLATVARPEIRAELPTSLDPHLWAWLRQLEARVAALEKKED